MNETTRVGFYGKLPIVGDFVSRGLPNDFIQSWDSWLQRAIAASQETLADQWLQRYLTSPIWRFALSPGLCGDKAIAGIVMPSVDKVGRYYPLTVAVVLDGKPPLPLLFSLGKVWFEQLEDAAWSGLQGTMDMAGFDQLIQSIPVLSVPTPDAVVLPTAGKNCFYTQLTNNEQLGDAFTRLNAQVLDSLMPGYSLWSSEGAEQIPAALVACEGLPPVGSYASFLCGPTPPDSIIIPMPTPPTAETVPEPQSLSSILAADKPALPLSWRSWAITHTGKRRKHNEDSLLDRPDVGLWVVADGMGGHKAGDVASQLIVKTLNDLLPIEPFGDYVKKVENYLQNVNTQLRQLAAMEYSGQLVGSTVVALVCGPENCAFLWAGDSRLYRLRDHKLTQLTEDHCADNDPNSSAWSVKSSNIITRAVGADSLLELGLEETDVLPDDIFLLCSDGLDKEMSLNEIEHIMQTQACPDIAEALVKEVLARGARDNVTVIVITQE